MVSTRSQEQEQRREGAMASMDLMTLLLSLQREMAEMKQRSEDEMRVLR